MSTKEQQKFNFLEHHLHYELRMLRHALSRCRSTPDQLEWNVHFVAFVVHARNLYNFLRNKDPKNFQARDFVDDIRYKATRSEAAISTFQKLRDQVLHLGKSRPINGPQKAQLGECEVVSRWIEQNLLGFIEVLEEPYASKWTWPVVSHKETTLVCYIET